MKQIEVTIIILKADEGKYLTQVSEDIDKRIVVPEIALGSNDSPDNWKEITVEEAEEILQL